MESRLKKRLIIIVIYLVLLVIFSFVVYNALKPEATCSDKIKNQSEEDIDCGGVCAPCKKIVARDLIMENKGFVENGRQGQYDFWALVSNPNNSFGAKKFRYDITLKDANGAVIFQRSGTSFVLPGEKKYIVENNLNSENIPAGAEFSISETEWMEFNNYYERPDLKIVNKSYNQISSGAGFSEAFGLLKNESSYDFNVIKVQVILKDAGGKIVALNSTEMRTVKSGEERDFRALWPSRFFGEVAGVETQAEVNIFESDAFLKNFTEAGNPSR